MISQTIYSTLNANAGVRAYVGEATSPQQSRIYPRRAPDNVARPYIVFHGISRTNLDTLSGVDDMENGLYQINCIVDAETSDQETVDLFADAVEAALEGNGYRRFRGDAGYDEETKSYMTTIDWSFLE